MKRVLPAVLCGAALFLGGCASLNETERTLVGGGAGLVLSAPLGISPLLGATAGAAAGLFSDDILGY
ncbi:hypothetical protein [Poseidonocella sp. HB161398]|uniref:hypothetical protein n=1 Tax=Poseidonocella sp. HB161398 TaxID=2320855 RepID=UPI001108D91E|nr:hypothetical protein [Poseidonocella sp. HB161398]